MKVLRWTSGILLAACLTLCALGAFAGEASMEGSAESTAIIAVFNNDAMSKSDENGDLVGTFLALPALLPDGASVAFIQGMELEAPVTTVRASDTAAIAAIASADRNTKKLTTNQQNSLSNTLQQKLAAWLHQPNTTAILLNANQIAKESGGFQWSELFKTIGEKHGSVWIVEYNNLKYDLAQALSESLALTPSGRFLTNDWLTIETLHPSDSASYRDSAMENLSSLLTTNFHMLSPEVSQFTSISSSGRASVLSVDLPHFGVKSARILLDDVPVSTSACWVVGDEKTPLTPLSVLPGLDDGRELRVYRLTDAQANSGGTMELTLPDASEAAAQGQAPATEAPAEEAAPSVYDIKPSAYIQYQPRVASKPIVSSGKTTKNSAFKVQVAIEDADLYQTMLQYPSEYKAFVRATSATGAAQDFTAVYDDASRMLLANVTLTRSGEYTLVSGIRFPYADIGEQLSPEEAAIRLTLDNASPQVAGSQKESVQLLFDYPFSNASQSAPHVIEQVSSLFTDSDGGVLTYYLSEQEPTDAKQVRTDNRYQLSLRDCFNVDYDKANDRLTIIASAQEATQAQMDKDFYLVALDDENGMARIQYSVALLSAKHLLSSSAGISGVALGERPENAERGVPLPVFVDFDFSALPPALSKDLDQHMKVTVRLLDAETNEDISLSELVWAEGEQRWTGSIPEPLQGGEYSLTAQAKLLNAENPSQEWTADGWSKTAAQSYSVENAAPVLSEAGNARAAAPDTLELRRGDSSFIPQTVTFHPSEYFIDDGPANSLRYSVDIADRNGSYKDAQYFGNRGKASSVTVGYQSSLRDPPLLDIGDATLSVAVTDRFTVRFGEPGEYTLFISAQDQEGRYGHVECKVLVKDWLMRRILWVSGAVAAALALALAILLTVRALKPAFGDGPIALALEDEQCGVIQSKLSLKPWKKRKIPLSELLLNASFPTVSWLDQVADQVLLTPTRYGVRLSLDKRARKSLCLMQAGVAVLDGRLTLNANAGVQIHSRDDSSTSADFLSVRVEPSIEPSASPRLENRRVV